VNVNLRPYYAEGSKTLGFEIIEQLGWKLPQHTVVCMASGSLLTKVHKAYKEFVRVGLANDTPARIHGAQASGCSPITTAVKNKSEVVRPIPNPQTIAKSLSIGTPADGYYAIRTMQETGGTGEDASDPEIIEGIKLLAETEGIFAETAGGVTVACAKKLIEAGKIPRNESIVLCITGYGLKTQEAIVEHVGRPHYIQPHLREFAALITEQPNFSSK
jgi:threonine synthase